MNYSVPVAVVNESSFVTSFVFLAESDERIEYIVLVRLNLC